MEIRIFIFEEALEAVAFFYQQISQVKTSYDLIYEWLNKKKIGYFSINSLFF
jgi:hypothetical protein